MKQIILTLAMLLTLSTTAVAGGQKHRHHPVATATKNVSTPAAKATAADSLKEATAKNQAASGAVEAYSDTTGVDEEEAEEYTPKYQTDRDDEETDEFNSIFGKSFAKGVGGVLIAILVITLVFLFLMAPVVVVILLLRFFIKRHNDRVALMEKAMASGQPIPELVKPINKRTPDHQWEVGVRNVSIGGGLMILFYLLGASGLVGVGALILCMGLGQMYIARHSINGKRREDELSNTDSHDIDRPEF